MNNKCQNYIKGIMFYYNDIFLEITFASKMPRENVTDLNHIFLYKHSLYPHKIKGNAAFTFRFGILPQAKDHPPPVDTSKLPEAEKMDFLANWRDYLIKEEEVKWQEWNIEKICHAITQHYPDARLPIRFDILCEW